MSNTAIDRVSKPSLSFITYSYHCINPLVHRYIQKEFGHITCSKHLVHRSEMASTLFGIEIWGEYAVSHTLSSQELACSTWSTTSCATSSTTRRICTHYVERV
ncbi:hypothetical protein HanPI659440_Chr04g0176701 [Helianthus annuus]|nr:hypothetical protein HanPI659440_Chr04g0176701 [Helianthus annuus]